ncbi:hypothetical protein AAY473_011140 [Plecturocebus cupreus]
MNVPLQQGSTLMSLGITSFPGKVTERILHSVARVRAFPDGQRPAYGRNSGIPAGSPSPTLLPTGIPGLFPMGLRRASWCDQNSVRTPFRIVAGRAWQKPHTALLWNGPPRARGASRAPARAVPLRRAVQGRGARPWSPQAGLRGPLPLPAPPRRQRQVRVHNCQARPQPPPAGFPAPRDYRSCGGSVAGSRGRGLGAGRGGTARAGVRGPPTAGRVTFAAAAPERPASEGPTQLPWLPPARVSGDRPELKFLDPLSLRRMRVPGRPRGRPLVTGAGRSSLAYERLGARRETSKRAPAAPGASCPGPFPGRAPGPQWGRSRALQARDGGGAPGSP